MKTNIINLISEKQKRLGRIIPKSEIISETELTKPTIERWLTGKVTRFDDKTIVALCRFLECEIGDLLYIDWNAVKKNGKKRNGGGK